MASLVLTLCAEGSGIRPQGQRCLSAEQAIVPQLHGHTSPSLFTVYSATRAKCIGGLRPIVWCQDCLSCTRMLTSSPGGFRETVKSAWMGADLHTPKKKNMLKAFRLAPVHKHAAAWPHPWSLQHVKPHCITSVCLLHTKLRPALRRQNTCLLQPWQPLLSSYAISLQAYHDCVIVAIQKKHIRMPNYPQQGITRQAVSLANDQFSKG